MRGGRSHVGVVWTACFLLGATGCPGDGGRETGETDASSATTGTDTSPTSSASTTETDTMPSTSEGPGPGSSPTSSDTDPSDTDSGSTGGPPGCGNGQPDAEEACDDGNDVNSDGCNNNCVESGSIVWTHTHAGGFAVADENWGVTTDDEGDAYVAGFTQVDMMDTRIFLRRYSRPGGLEWTQTVGAANVVDRGFSITFDGGALYATGEIDAGAQGSNIWYARYDPAGGQTWQFTETGNPVRGVGPIPGNDSGRGIAVGPNGAVVVGFLVATGQGQDAWIRQLDGTGAPTWTQTHNGVSSGNDQATAVAVDSLGNVIAVGFETTTVTSRNIWVTKLEPTAGGAVWTVSHDGPDTLADEAFGVAITDNDEIVVAGYEGVTAADGRYWVRRLDVDGEEVWTDTDDGPGGEGARARQVAIAPDGDLLVAGIERDEGYWNAIVVRYAETGQRKWEQRFTGIAMTDALALDIAVADDGTIYVAGTVDRGIDDRDAWIARLAP